MPGRCSKGGLLRPQSDSSSPAQPRTIGGRLGPTEEPPPRNLVAAAAQRFVVRGRFLPSGTRPTHRGRSLTHYHRTPADLYASARTERADHCLFLGQQAAYTVPLSAVSKANEGP
jgi:hypothetical protein